MVLLFSYGKLNLIFAMVLSLLIFQNQKQKMFRIKSCILLIFIFLIIQKSQAQEMVLPLQENAVLKNYKKPIGNTARKPTALGLPFFEDFTDNSPYPNTERWVENEVYINNTMAKGIISRGVATFDALNAQGKVYSDTVAAYETIYADSLTSLAFDLSTYQPSDSLYLSFSMNAPVSVFSPRLLIH